MLNHFIMWLLEDDEFVINYGNNISDVMSTSKNSQKKVEFLLSLITEFQLLQVILEQFR